MKTLNAAVIGTGNMGKHHVRVYSELPNIKLVGISDIDEVIGQQQADSYKTKYYNNFIELIDNEKIDVVSICVPTKMHFDVATECIKRGINVLLEKPITDNSKDAVKLINLANQKKVKLLVGHIERFNPAVKKVKEMVKRGQLGKIIAMTTQRVGGLPPKSMDADITVDLAIHDIDISNYLLEELPNKVISNRQKNFSDKRDDSVELFLKYKHSSSYIQSNWISPVKIRKLNITGTKGYLELDYINQKVTFYKIDYSKFTTAAKDFSNYILTFTEPDATDIPVVKKEPLKEEITYFINCIQKRIQLDPTFAAEALKIALYE